MSASQQPSHFQFFGIHQTRNQLARHRPGRNGVLCSLATVVLALLAILLVLNLHAAGQDTQRVSSTSGVFAATTSLNGPGNVFLTAQVFATGTGNPSIAIADFNGDGKPDLAVALQCSGCGVGVYLGKGDGTFQTPVSTVNLGGAAFVATGDFNGDGKMDLVVIGAVPPSQATVGLFILLGNGDGTFTLKSTNTGLTNQVSAVVGDFNGDGKLDVAVLDRTTSGDVVLLFLGNGDGSLQAPASISLGSSAGTAFPTQIVAADFNKDGHLDLAVSFQNQAAVEVVLGNGNGTFQAPRVLALPSGQGGYGIAVGDLNGDGVPDLVATSPNIGGISVFLGTGNGNFTPVNNPQSGTLPTATGAVPFGGATSVAVGDFNKDGKLDVIVGLSGVNGAASVAVLLGNGDGTLQPESLFETADFPTFVAVADFNGDGNLDWITNGNQGSFVVVGLGRGDGTFLAARNFTTGISPGGPAIADFNKDGKLDLVVPNSGSNNTSILLGNGDGSFQPAVNIAVPGLQPVAVVTGDFNNDGSPDFVVFNGSGCPNTVYTFPGKGDGTFQPATSTSLISCNAINSMLVGDFNGDGKLDIAIGLGHDTGNPLIQILLGKGDGTFTVMTPFTTGGISFAGMAAGDLNKDGKLDLVITDFRQGLVKIFLGNGDGTFQAPTNLAVGRFPGGLVLGDFRGSGNLDIIVENELDGNAEILPGNGNGTFNSGTIINTGGNPLQNILAGDFNLDGKLDFIGNEGDSATGQNAIRLFLSNGDGTFQAPQEYLADRLRQVWIVADFNRDGAPDVLSVDSGEHFLTMFLNQTPPPIAVSPASLSFGNQLVGTTSSALAIKVSNNGTTATTVGVAVSGDFAETNTCPVSPATLAPAASCTISVTFKPTATGPLNGSVTVSDTLPGSPQIVALSGTGVAPIVTLGGNSISFGNQIVGMSSAVQMVTLTNTGTATLTISSIAITGTNSGDFSQTNTCGASVNAGANCSISVTFKPTATGSRAASVTITDNASGSPQSVSLTGTGIAPVVSFGGTTTLTYSGQPVGTTSAPQSVTLTNTGNAALAITSIAITGANSGDFAQTNTCPASPATLAAGSNCMISVTFDPTATGARNASLAVTDDASGSPQSISLTGTGTPAAPAVGLSATTLTFSSQLVGTTSAAQSVTLTNTGNAALTIASIAITGTNSGDFAQTNTCPASPATLAAGSNCSISVTFKPTATGTRNASLTITDNAANSPQSVSLTGTGVAPVVSLSPTSLSFGNQPVGTSSTAQNVTLSNTGNAALTITSIAITGANSGDFSETNTCPASPATLAASANCMISVTFKPTATGSRSASVSITDNASGSPQNVSLTGTGTQAPAVTLSPTSLSFGNQRVGTSSAAQSVTLTNSGNATLTLSIAITGTNSGDFSQTNTCGASVAAGANCMINVTFNPTATVNRSASVTITDNASGGPHSVTLTGTGTAPAVTLAPTSLNFAGQLVTTASAVQAIMLTNSGTAALNITSITITGTNSGDFSETNTCGASVAAGANCSISVTFKPTATGNRAASVTITDDASGSPQAAALSGTGTDFTIDVAAGGSSTATVPAGQPATYNLQVTPVSGFNGAVTLSCSGAPSEATCTSSVALVTPNGNSASAFAVNVTTTAPSILAPRGMPPKYPPMTWIRIVLPWVLLFTLALLARVTAARHHSRWAFAPAFVVVLGILGWIGGCGGGGGGGGNHNPGTPAGTYTLTVAGGSNGVNHTLQLSLKVN